MIIVKYNLSRIFLILALLLFGGSYAIPRLSYGTKNTKTEIKSDQIEEIEKELSREKKRLLKYGEKERGLLRQLSELEETIAARRRHLDELKAKVLISKGELEDRQGKLTEVENKLKEVESRLEKRLVAFYKYAKRGYMQLLATSSGMDQLRKRSKYLKVIMMEDQILFDRMAGMQKKREKGISNIRDNLDLIKRLEEAEKASMASIKKDMNQKVLLLMKIHKEKEFYETVVKELQLGAKELRKTLQKLDKVDPRPGKLPTGFNAAKGRLPLPVRGKVARSRISRRSRNGPGLKGVHIAGVNGANVEAVFPGRVEYSGWLRGYGEIIVLNHGSRYFTIYAQLSKRLKEVKELVERGETIGLLGNNGSSGDAGLYFEIRRGGVNLDPMKWLKVN